MELNKFNKRLIAARRPFSVVEIKNDPRITNVNGKQSSYNIVGGNGSGIAEFGCDELSATWFCEAANRYAAEIYRGKYPTNEQETPADIIAEKRREADELEASSYKPHQFLRERIAELRREADRLEAAVNRECGDAAKLREVLSTISEVSDDWRLHANTMPGALDRILELAQAALAATKKEKGAKWLNGKDYECEFAYCSKCGLPQWADWDSHSEAKENIGNFAEKYKYCPECGAKMEGGEYVE